MAAFDSPEYWNSKVRGAECLNAQAARSIVPIAELRTRMVMAGHSKAEIVSAAKAAFDNKQLPDLESGNMVFMMSKSAYLYDAGDHKAFSSLRRSEIFIDVDSWILSSLRQERNVDSSEHRTPKGALAPQRLVDYKHVTPTE